jgi:hypothetical protein
MHKVVSSAALVCFLITRNNNHSQHYLVILNQAYSKVNLNLNKKKLGYLHQVLLILEKELWTLADKK